jgi:hypothetical protein
MLTWVSYHVIEITQNSVVVKKIAPILLTKKARLLWVPGANPGCFEIHCLGVQNFLITP